MAKQVIQAFQIKAQFTQEQMDFIEKVRCNPAMEEYIELYLAGIL